MNIFYNISDLKHLKAPIVTVGNFDGVHRGHLQIFKAMLDIAKEENKETLVITFRVHPKKVLFPESSLRVLSDLDEKIDAIEQAGIENVLVIDFDQNISSMHAGEFIHEVLVNEINASCVVMGYDNALGKDRKGNIDYLERFAKKYSFRVVSIGPCQYEGHPVSSTWIRNELLDGNLLLANKLLGRNYLVNGMVVEGFKRGRKLGYPTANLDYEHVDKVVPEDGVYAVVVFLQNGTLHYGMANIGKNPTFHNQKKSIEVHIFNYDSDLYGQKLKIEFVKRVRGEIEFENPEKLVEQITKDQEDINDLFCNRDT
jgi:riboflavin kinase/FMN adenylyltransferase